MRSPRKKNTGKRMVTLTPLSSLPPTVQQRDSQTLPKNHCIVMSMLSLDIQTVLLNARKIESMEIANIYAALLWEKFGVATKVTVIEGNLLLYVYRIDLDLIADFYDPATKQWIFNFDRLASLPNFDFDQAIRITPIGRLVGADLPRLLNDEEESRFSLLCDDTYYSYFRYYGNTLLRLSKQDLRTMVVARLINITACAQYHNKLFIAESGGITGNEEIYCCDLNGENLTPLHCLGNERVLRAGHLMSLDKVNSMHIADDSLEIVVTRNDGNGIYDYKIVVTEVNGELSFSHKNMINTPVGALTEEDGSVCCPQQSQSSQREDHVGEGYYFENVLELILYGKNHGQDRCISWLKGDNYISEYNKGYQLFEAGKYTDALETLNRCLLLNPIGLNARFEICEAHLMLHQVHEAKNALLAMTRYLVEGKYIAKFYRRIGFISIEEGNFDCAVAAYSYSLNFESHPSVEEELTFIQQATRMSDAKLSSLKKTAVSILRQNCLPVLKEIKLN